MKAKTIVNVVVEDGEMFCEVCGQLGHEDDANDFDSSVCMSCVPSLNSYKPNPLLKTVERKFLPLGD